MAGAGCLLLWRTAYAQSLLVPVSGGPEPPPLLSPPLSSPGSAARGGLPGPAHPPRPAWTAAGGTSARLGALRRPAGGRRRGRRAGPGPMANRRSELTPAQPTSAERKAILTVLIVATYVRPEARDRANRERGSHGYGKTDDARRCRATGRHGGHPGGTGRAHPGTGRLAGRTQPEPGRQRGALRRGRGLAGQLLVGRGGDPGRRYPAPAGRTRHR